MIIHEIKLVARKTLDVIPLNYREAPVTCRQRRLDGRVALWPDLDLTAFRCRAVVDWIDVSIRTTKPTQARWLNVRIDRAIGRNCNVQDLGGDGFKVRFQDPDLAKIEVAVRSIEASHGISAPVDVVAMEVSVDFTPAAPGDEAQRRRLVAILARHFRPGRDVISDGRDWPRFTWGRRSENTAGVLPRKKDWVDVDRLMFNGNDCTPSPDATFYVGEKGARSAWRIMDKILDQQNLVAGTAVVLPDELKRVRIEVTLRKDELQDLGIRTLADAGAFKFTRLHKPFFCFMTPTFAVPKGSAAGWRQSAVKVLEDERRTKFLNTGIIGLEAMDNAWKDRRESHREGMRAIFRERRWPLTRIRIGGGQAGTMVAYLELNARVEMALRKLTKRTQAQAKVKVSQRC